MTKKKKSEHRIAILCGWLANILFILCFVPQVAHTIITKDVSGLSIHMFYAYLVACLFGMVYTVSYLKEWPLTFGYGFEILLVVAEIVLYYSYV